MNSVAHSVPESTDTGYPQQLGLRLFAWARGCAKIPPERALWRELLRLAFGAERHSIHVGGHDVSSSDTLHIAHAFYFRCGTDGVVEGFSVAELAKDTHRSERTVRAAIKACNVLRIIRSKRENGRRRPFVHRMNLGGLTWSAVRQRVHRDAEQPVPSAAQPAGLDASAAGCAALSAAQPAALKGYTEGLYQEPPNPPQAGGAASGQGQARRRQPRATRLSAADRRALDRAAQHPLRRCAKCNHGDCLGDCAQCATCREG